jgi:magnesium chelatase family protein
LPEGNAPQAALADGARILPARTLLEVVAHLASEAPLAVYAEAARATPPAYAAFADVKGQQQVKRALEVAAAGGHSVLMVGPPGTGKSMLAARFPGILPPLSEAEALEVAAIHSVSSKGFEVVNWGAAISRTASQRLGGDVGRRRQPAAPRRDLAGALRRPVRG